jgi:hypothetical protein
MLEENISGSEHANVPADSVGSCSTSRRRNICAWGGEFELCEVSKVPYRNSETNSFPDRRAEFETKADVDQEQSVW